MITTVRIDPDDELPAILERLPAQGGCVLVLPPHARALSSVVGAKLLARRADTTGVRVAVVSEDRAVMAHVRAAGIPVTATVEEAQSLLSSTSPNGREEEKTILTRHIDLTNANVNGHEDDPEEVHTSKTTPVPVIPPLEDTTALPMASPPDPAGSTEHDEHVKPGGPGEHSYRFVAGEPRVEERGVEPGAEGEPRPRPQARPRETGRVGKIAPDAVADAEPSRPSIRGHSGGSRAARGSAPMASPAGGARAGSTRAVGLLDELRERIGDLQGGRLMTRILPSIAVLLFLLFLGWLAVRIVGGIFAPTATLTLQPRPIPISGSTIVRASPNLLPAQRSPSRVPLTQVDQSERGTVLLPVRGTRTLPGRPATGMIQLGNLVAVPLTVPAGTVFTTALNARGFVTTRQVALPPAKKSFTGAEYPTVDAPVRAVVGGSAGGTGPRTVINPPAQFSGALEVTNTVAITGGTDVYERIVKPNDLAVAAANLFNGLVRQARHDVERRAGAALEQHTQYIARSPVIPRMAPDHKTATLTISIVLHDLYVRKSDLRPAALAALTTPANSQLNGSSVVWTTTWAPNNTLTLAVTGHAVPPFDSAAQAAVRQAVRAKSIADAQAYLNGRPDLAAAEIKISPSWADHLPSDLSRINLTVEEPR